MANTGTIEAGKITIERVFDAPIEQVWAAFTEPDKVDKWWGPKDFTSHDNRVNLQVGGKYVFCMQGPAGTEWDKPMYSGGEYKEIVPLKKLVFTDNFTDAEGNVVSGREYGMDIDATDPILITVTFEEVEGKTKLTLVHEGLPEGEMADQTKAGWNESFDKLAESLR